MRSPDVFLQIYQKKVLLQIATNLLKLSFWCKNQLEDRGENREQEPSRKGGGKGAGKVKMTGKESAEREK